MIIIVSGSKKYRCKEEGYQKDPQDCSKFYRCVRTESGGLDTYEFKCGEGTVYSEEHMVCVYPKDSNRPECADYNANLVDGGNKHIFILYIFF